MLPDYFLGFFRSETGQLILLYRYFQARILIYASRVGRGSESLDVFPKPDREFRQEALIFRFRKHRSPPQIFSREIQHRYFLSCIDCSRKELEIRKTRKIQIVPISLFLLVYISDYQIFRHFEYSWFFDYPKYLFFFFRRGTVRLKTWNLRQ